MTRKSGQVIGFAWVLGTAVAGCSDQPSSVPAKASVGSVIVSEKDLGKAAFRQAGRLRFQRTWTDEAAGTLRVNFTFSIPSNGSYCVGSWSDGLQDQAYALEVDGKPRPGFEIRLSKDGWQSALAKNPDGSCRLDLTAGAHTVSVVTEGPALPNVEALLLGANEREATLSEAAYSTYVDQLVAKAGPAGDTKIVTRALPQGPSNINFSYALNQPVPYTYLRTLRFNAGDSVTYETSAATPNCDPVLHFYNVTPPTTHSWTDNDGAGFPNARISVTIPETGYYAIMMRSRDESSTGRADLLLNGAPLARGAAVSGRRLALLQRDLSVGHPENFFTSNNSVPDMDTRIWLHDRNTDNIVAANDDYAWSGAFIWGNNARIKGRYAIAGSLTFASYGAYNPLGNADVYGNVDVGMDWTGIFPYLNPDDSMEGSYAFAEDNYNCIAWSGGMTSAWLWPPSPGNPWYVEGDELQSFHNFYANRCASGGSCPRYSGDDVWNYGNYSTNPEGAAVALWWVANQYGSPAYTHASVSQLANGYPHGYDWESKPGWRGRIFHPRDALRDKDRPSYGNIVGYYQKTGVCADCASGDQVTALSLASPAQKLVTEAESIRRGHSVPEAIEGFDIREKSKLRSRQLLVESQARQRFTDLLAAWKATFAHASLAIQSNPELYRRSSEYERFEAQVRRMGKTSLPLLIQELDNRDPITGPAIVQLVLPGQEADLQAAVQHWVEHQVGSDGKFQIFSPENARIRFAKRLLQRM